MTIKLKKIEIEVPDGMNAEVTGNRVKIIAAPVFVPTWWTLPYHAYPPNITYTPSGTITTTTLGSTTC